MRFRETPNYIDLVVVIDGRPDHGPRSLPDKSRDHQYFLTTIELDGGREKREKGARKCTVGAKMKDCEVVSATIKDTKTTERFSS